MPDWVHNELSLQDVSDERIAEVLAQICDDDGNLSFSKIAPMPESLDLVSGNMTDYAVVAYLTDNGRTELTPEKTLLAENVLGNTIGSARVIECSFEYVKTHQEEMREVRNFNASLSRKDLMTYCEAGQKYVANYEKYGAATWYDWNCQNWGTKWEPSYVSVDGSMISFDTAWSCPDAILETLSERFPDVHFVCHYADKSLDCNCGTIELWGKENLSRHVTPDDPSTFARNLWELGYVEFDLASESLEDSAADLKDVQAEMSEGLENPGADAPTPGESVR